MILIRKKSLVLVLTCLVISFALILGIQQLKTKIVPVVSLPVSNKTIVLDAGHGVPDEGEFLLTLTKMTNLIINIYLQNSIKSI